MDKGTEAIKVTEQEMETLVPVGVVGGSAGPSRPSSGDRIVATVVDQAVATSITTGTKTEKKPFAKTFRSPHQTKSNRETGHPDENQKKEATDIEELTGNSSGDKESSDHTYTSGVRTPIRKIVNVFEDFIRKGKKEMLEREGDIKNEQQQKKTDLDEAVEENTYLPQLLEKIKELEKICKETQNVHKPVKKLAAEIGDLMRNGQKENATIRQKFIAQKNALKRKNKDAEAKNKTMQSTIEKQEEEIERLNIQIASAPRD